jgi:hypothetical protein
MNEALYLLGFSPKLIHGKPTMDLEKLSYESYYDDKGIEDKGIEYFDADTLALAELFGIERLEAGSVLAWYKRIDRSDFVGAAGERNLSDINWLTPRVMAHEEAVAQLSSQSSFYPARFGSLFSSESSLHSYAVSVTQGLDEFFCMIRGKQEWGLKLYGNYAKAAQMQAEQSGLIRDGVPLKGKNYLKLKQLQRELSRADSGIFVQARDAAIDSIKDAFANVKVRSVKASNNVDANEELLSSMAVLERIEDAGLVFAWVEKWNLNSSLTGGIRVELSGPWPAYSFCPALTATYELDSNHRTEYDREVA